MNEIICGNCVDVMATFPDNYVDLTVTSPPYDNIRTYKTFVLDLHQLGIQAFRTLKDGGLLCMIIQDGTKDFGKSCTTYRTIVDYVDNIGFKLFENIVYSRHGRPGAWWNKRFRVDHEYILMFLKGSKPKYFNKEPLKILSKHAGEIWHGTQRKSDGSLIPIKKKKQAEKKCRGSVWHYNTSNTENDPLKMQHPATFPDALAKDLITCFSELGELVLDPMCGSGTTCKMAKQLGRNYIGIDISQEYCDIAVERVKNVQLTLI